ncbi:uncharacterized protein LOC126399954 isoform X1 [Epinephelus moara]|uniref:uncharacterized protein LOC126399954 isoform X1 n=1 Tax=Epinephelus moara TaxID=300413 RepID=UPI00214EDFD7|nr:uncharacterized protein LOC126399954 isoform X1 [Epinephelus moara]
MRSDYPVCLPAAWADRADCTAPIWEPTEGHEACQRSKLWLQPGSEAHKALVKTVKDKRLLKDLGHLTKCVHTTSLEVYHSMYLKYLPQRTHFGYDVMIHASMLAALDHNNNANREQAALQDGENVGEPKFKISWSKVHKRFRAKPVAVQKDYGYMKAMVADVLSSVSDSNHGMDIRLNQTHIMAPPERPSRSHIISKTQQFSRIKQLDFSRVCVTLQIKMFVLPETCRCFCTREELPWLLFFV